METIRESVLILWGTPIYIVLILLELVISNLRQQPTYTWQNTIENIYLSVLNASLDLIMRGTSLIVLIFFYERQIIRIENPITHWILLVIGLDFLFYLLHLVDHKVRLFWVIHVTHHSSEEFNLTVGFRSSVFQPLYRFLYFIPLAWMGFKPVDILFVYSASQIYGILLHTKWVGKLGPLEWVFATPSHHRVHHGSNPEYIDKNMGMLLIVWDRLFGTFQEEIVAVQYGTTKKLNSHSPHTVVFHEWVDLIEDLKQSKTPKYLLKILLGPPGSSQQQNQSPQINLKREDYRSLPEKT